MLCSKHEYDRNVIINECFMLTYTDVTRPYTYKKQALSGDFQHACGKMHT